MLPENVVLHVSGLVELLLHTRPGASVAGRIRSSRPHAPAQIDADVLACLARLVDNGKLPPHVADDAVRRLATMPLVRHSVPHLLSTVWTDRTALGPGDQLYVELARSLNAPLVGTDPRLADAYRKVELFTD
jgi:predicted nucleic acid-binding protein